MRDRTSRAFFLFGVCLCLSTARPARAETDVPEGGSPEPEKPSDSGPPAPSESGGGLFEQSVAAAAPAKTEAATPGAPPFQLNGYVRGDFFAGMIPGANPLGNVGPVPKATFGEMKANYGELALQLRTAKSTYGDGFAEVRVRYGLQGADYTTFLDVREAYVNAYLGPLDLRVGKQIIVWGRADALNPTSNITPVDFRIRSPLEDDIRVGNVGARAFLRFAPFRLEAVWMPSYLPTELPNIQLPQFVAFAAPTYPSQDLRNGLAAGRLHLELPAIEMSVSYLRGYALMPGLTLTELKFDPTTPAVGISRTAYQQQVIGFDFSTALGDVVTLRGEAAYRRPVDYDKAMPKPWEARPDAQYVLGVDHTFGSLSVIAQYMGRYVFDWVKAPNPQMTLDTRILMTTEDPTDPSLRNSVTTAIDAQLAKTSQILFSQTAQLQHLATLRLEWTALHETLSMSALGLVNVTTHEWALMPRIGYKFTDAMIGYIGAQIFRGPNDTLFGLIDDDLTAGYIELRYTF
jgi:hypothetical protein